MNKFTDLVFLALSISFLGFLSGCDDDDDDKKPLVIPVEYDGSSFAINAATEIAVGQQLTNLRNEAFKGRTKDVTVSAETLNALYTAGDPSLKLLITSHYGSKLEGATGWLAELAKASGKTYSPGAPAGDGGFYGGYLFDENGLELEQLIEKGQFGAVQYNHALTLLSGSLDNTTTDKVLAIFGANPSFPNTTNATNPDKFAAIYAARRTNKDDPEGFYFILKNNFIKLQAAISAGNTYKVEQQEAIEAIKETWEKVNAATIINYCHDVISKLSATDPNDTQKASALHAYGECVGFVHGWRTISDKMITDAQIDELLTLLNAPANGTPTSYTFVTDRENQLPKLQQVISKLKTIYGFSDQQVNDDFKKNWVAVQGR